MKEKYFNQPSVMTAQRHFAQVPSAQIDRSRFDRSHSYKTTFDAGKLVPIYVDEVLPGDTFTMNATAFARLATPLKPVMDNMNLDVHFFFVPNRLVWENWQKFMGERPTPDFDPNTLAVPQRAIPISDIAPGAADLKVSHYFGLPYVRSATGSPTYSVNTMPFRAYQLIWLEWYRDQNLQDPDDYFADPFSIDDGPDTGDIDLLPRGKRPDYFTTCLPWPQKGEQVSIPLGDSAPIVNNDTTSSAIIRTGNLTLRQGTGANTTFNRSNSTTSNMITDSANPGSSNTNAYQYVSGIGLDVSQLEADLTSATSISINDLREAITVQRLLERDARGGTRYIEIILSHFGVQSDDARLQRPEYLGGGTSVVNLNPIAATVAQESTPQANLSAVGTSLNRDVRFSKSFTEHGFVIGLVSARADLTYQQGIERFWTRETRNEYYWPTFANLGEEAVLNREIFFTGDAIDDEIFGYQERYGDYRYKPSRITGLFNSAAAASLDVWHLSQDFAETPALSGEFIEENPPIDRIIAVPSEPHFLCDIWLNLKTDRPMPIYGVPGLDKL